MKKSSETKKEVVRPTEPGSGNYSGNDVFTPSITELEERLRLQELIFNLSTQFIDLPSSEVDRQIEETLKQVVEFLGIDRSSLSEFSKDLKELHTTHSYAVPGVEATPRIIANTVFPYLSGKLLAGENFVCENSAELPEVATLEKSYSLKTGLKSHLSIPVSIGGTLQCAISFTTFRRYRSWSEEHIGQLKKLGEVFAQAIYRKRAEQEIQNHLKNLKKQYDFEKLISGLSTRFVNLEPSAVDQQIVEGLKLLIEFFGGDRSSLLQITNGKEELITTHSYTVKGVKKIERIPFKQWFPWVATKIIQGELFYFSSAIELPAEALIDRESFTKLEVKSNITMPLFFGGQVKYVLTIGAIKQERIWPEEIIPRLRLIGEIFVNALIRKEDAEALQKNGEQLHTAYTEITQLSEQLMRENIYLQEEIKAGYNFEEMIGHSGGLKYLFYKIKQVAPTDTTVLIEGETGTGKELVARTLHAFSNRKGRPLIKVDCASLPANLIESELFGHQKGAFTGAHARRIGRFELADGATIFLDEIAEIPLGLQSKLLRVLQDGEFERLGSSQTLKVNVRIIAATNRILKEEVNNGHFREDLFYRLSIFPLSLPPLRERKEDIPLLAEAFVQRFAKKLGKNITTIPSKIQNALQNYSWPGNVRELENVIERAVITTDGSSLQLMDLLEETPAKKAASTPKVSLEERERDYIIEVLEDTFWRIEGKNGAAVILGLHPDTLRSRIKKLGIRKPSHGKS